MRCGNRLAEVRQARGWSQGDLAAAVLRRFPDARADRSAVSRWEHSRPMPSLTMALLLAAVLGEPIERLFPLP